MSVPLAALAVSLLVLAVDSSRVEHVLLALSAVFVTYIARACSRSPDWGAAAHGLVVPALPGTRDGPARRHRDRRHDARALGSRFIQSYAVDKRLTPRPAATSVSTFSWARR